VSFICTCGLIYTFIFVLFLLLVFLLVLIDSLQIANPKIEKG
jgi:hypothetical protein